MARHLNTLDIMMILVCVVAFAVLVSLAIFTWIKWRRRQLKSPTVIELAQEPADPAAAHVQPQAFNAGYLNVIGRDSPNLSGSRTFLNDDVLKQKPFPKQPSAPTFHTNDVVYHANSERDPDKMLAGDVVYHANGPFGNNTTAADTVQSGQIAFNVDGPDGVRRWSESMARTEPDPSEDGVSHRKNTYL